MFNGERGHCEPIVWGPVGREETEKTEWSQLTHEYGGWQRRREDEPESPVRKSVDLRQICVLRSLQLYLLLHKYVYFGHFNLNS
jgi:hypothetical protein